MSRLLRCLRSIALGHRREPNAASDDGLERSCATTRFPCTSTFSSEASPTSSTRIRQAVHDYLAELNLDADIVPIDDEAAYWQKKG